MEIAFELLGEMFKGDSADTCAEKYPLVLIGGRAQGLVYADPVAKTPIGASGNFIFSCFIISTHKEFYHHKKLS